MQNDKIMTRSQRYKASMNKIFHRFSLSFKKLDLFGVNVNIYFDNQTKFKSKFGGFVSLIILTIILFTFGNNILDWKNYKNARIISSLQSRSVTELVSQNLNYTYQLNPNNYYVYFSPILSLSTGNLPYSEMLKYFTFNYQYHDANGISWDLESENCLKQQQNIFLNLPPGGNFQNQSKFPLCIKNYSLLFGMEIDSKHSSVITPYLSFSITSCQNSSKNNNFCASQKDIYQISNNLMIQASIPKTVFDFKNTQNPKKRIYEYEYYHMDKSLVLSFINYLIPVTYYTDTGIIQGNEVEDSINYNSEKLNYQANLRNSDADVFFYYTIKFGFNNQSYTLQNPNLSDVLGMFGGSISIFMIIGRIIVVFYNNIILKHELANATFEPLSDEREKTLYSDFF